MDREYPDSDNPKEESQQLKPGDIVQLKSGSQKLTVEKISSTVEGDLVHVVWSIYDENRIVKDVILAAALVKK